jgi:predicted phage terminase large subunit-like protein
MTDQPAAVETVDIETRLALREKLLERARVQARTDFYVFVKLMAPIIMPEFKDGRHIRVICEKLQKLEAREIKRLMIFLAPGSMKSRLASILFPAWCFGRKPTEQILAVSHSISLAEEFGGRTRDILKEPEYQLIFPETRMREDSQASGRWKTTRDGMYYAAGAGSSIAGFRGGIGIGDDLLSEKTAMSKLERQKLNAWWLPGFMTRMLPDAPVVLINTRWALDDVSGYCIEMAKDKPPEEQWEIVSIPAILDEEGATLLGLQPGDSYWPEMWPLRLLESTRSDMIRTEGRRFWSALYLQSPILDDGNIFKREHFQLWEREKPPSCDYILMSMDTAFSTKDSADFSAIQVWGIWHYEEHTEKGEPYWVPNMTLLSAQKGRWDFNELVEKAQTYYERYAPDAILIEKKASGQSLIQVLRRFGLPVLEYQPDKDKISRAYACQPILESGRLWVPQREWAQSVVDECLAFPLAEHDDQVDTLTQSVLWMRDGWRLLVPSDTDYLPEDEDKKPPPKRNYWRAVQPL